MDVRTNQPFSIMLIERGARWSWNALDHHGEDCLMLAQQEDESPLVFAERVAGRLGEASERGRALRRAVLATGPSGRDAIEGRRRIFRTLSSAWPAVDVDIYDEEAPDSRAA